KKLCHKAVSAAENDIEQAISSYEQAVELYEGEYLEELTTEEWIWSLRNKYRELLVNSLLDPDPYLSKKRFMTSSGSSITGYSSGKHHHLICSICG
ncbi:MAG: BTAD domain-containing putative transcriptional regulator, partial [Halanaerobium sp.]